MYGHSCLGGHGKRSSNDEMDSVAPLIKPDSVEVFRSSPELNALSNELDSSIVHPRRVDPMSTNLAKQLRRIEQYRQWKRLQSLFDSQLAKKRLSSEPFNLDWFVD
jgi:hypothetical protein